jgi:superfamily II DNA/RNA helicase
MLDMGFLPISGHLSCIMQQRQTLLFSATMPPASSLAREFLHDPVTNTDRANSARRPVPTPSTP